MDAGPGVCCVELGFGETDGVVGTVVIVVGIEEDARDLVGGWTIGGHCSDISRVLHICITL